MSEPNAKNVGEFLTALRKAKGMTQQEVADRLCVTNKAISRWECGDGYPEITILPAVAELYGVTVDEILKGARIPPDDTAKQEKAQANTERQIKRFVRSLSDFCTYASIISAALTFVGLILLFVFSYGIFLPYIGAGLSAVFLFFAASVQVYVCIRVQSRGRDNELLEERAAEIKAIEQRLAVCSFHVYSFIVFTLLLTLALIIFSDPFAVPKFFVLLFAPFFSIWLAARQISLGVLRKKDAVPRYGKKSVSVLFIVLSVIMCLAPAGCTTSYFVSKNYSRSETQTVYYSEEDWAKIEEFINLTEERDEYLYVHILDDGRTIEMTAEDSLLLSYTFEDFDSAYAVYGYIEALVWSNSDSSFAANADEKKITYDIKVYYYVPDFFPIIGYVITAVCAGILWIVERRNKVLR